MRNPLNNNLEEANALNNRIRQNEASIKENSVAQVPSSAAGPVRNIGVGAVSFIKHVEEATKLQAQAYVGNQYQALLDGIKSGAVPSSSPEAMAKVREAFQGIISDAEAKYSSDALGLYSIGQDPVFASMTKNMKDSLNAAFDQKNQKNLVDSAKSFLDPSYNKMSLRDFFTSLKASKGSFNNLLGETAVDVGVNKFIKTRTQEAVADPYKTHNEKAEAIKAAYDNGAYDKEEADALLGQLNRQTVNAQVSLNPYVTAAANPEIYRMLAPLYDKSVRGVQESFLKETDPYKKLVLQRYSQQLVEAVNKNPYDAVVARGEAIETPVPQGSEVNTALAAQVRLTEGAKALPFSSAQQNYLNTQSSPSLGVDLLVETQNSLGVGDGLNYGSAILNSGDQEQIGEWVFAAALRDGQAKDLNFDSYDAGTVSRLMALSSTQRYLDGFTENAALSASAPGLAKMIGNKSNYELRAMTALYLYKKGFFNEPHKPTDLEEEFEVYKDDYIKEFVGDDRGHYVFGGDPAIVSRMLDRVDVKSGTPLDEIERTSSWYSFATPTSTPGTLRKVGSGYVFRYTGSTPSTYLFDSNGDEFKA